MGLALPQVVTSDRASSAQVIDGSLKFDSGKNQFLKQTFVANGNKKTFTYSFWAKKTLASASGGIIFAGDNNVDGNNFEFRDASDKLRIYSYQNNSAVDYRTTAEYRDTSGWKHFLVSIDSTNGTASDRMKLYVNGERVTSFSTSTGTWGDNIDYKVNTSGEDHYIGLLLNSSGAQSTLFDGSMSQFYFIDGLALGPGYFGYTDPLTNTWRPKKFRAEGTTVNDGTVWSNSLTTNAGDNFDASGPKVDAFDGDSTDKCYTANNSDGTTQNTSYIQFNSPVVLNGDVEIYVDNGNAVFSVDSSGGLILLGKNTSGSDNQRVGLGYIQTSKLRVLMEGGSRPAIGAISVDGVIMQDSTTTNLAFGTNGFYLPMDGNSPIGEDKSGIVTPNNGTIWSNSLTSSSGFRSSEPKSNAFDGDTSSICSAIDNGTITFTSPVTFASNSTIQVIVHGGDHTVTVNGGANQTISAGSLQTVTYSNSGNATFIMTFQRATVADTGVRAIEINGVILTDGLKGNSWTPVNFGGSVALDNPQVSGARPILNTTQGGTQAGVGVFGSRENVGYAVTVYDDGGGNKYYIDGTKQATLNGLIRGATYTFDTSDSTIGSTHPFRLSATSAHGTEYTDGVVAITGAATTITIPHNAPNSLYYYCTAHSGMGSSITGITTNVSLADPYAWKNVLALPLVGSDDDVSNSVNSGSTTKVTASTNAVASSAASNFYGGSWIFDGSGDYIAVTDNADLAFGTGDLTVELWVYPNTLVSNDCLYDGRQSTGSATTGFSIVVNSSGQVQTYTAGGYRCSSTAQLKVGKWSHIAVVRSSGTDTLFMDGIAQADTDTTNGNYTDQKCRIGSDVNGDESWGGHISDFRLYKGVAKYTSNFVVPATSPDILPDTPSGVSGGSKLAKVTDGAVSFDGTTDFLSISSSTDFDFSGINWTVELFVYANSTSGVNILIENRSNGTGGWSVQLNNGNIQNYLSSGVALLSTAVAANKWYHIALVRNSSTTTLYIDGVSAGTTSTDAGSTASDGLTIGARADGNYSLNGFISNIRTLKGTALYTANFTPPTRELTNVTNTKLLCCQSNTQAGSAAVAPNVSGVNDGREWSHFTTASGGFNGSYPKYYLFDGQTPADSNRAEAASNDVPINIDFSPAITVSSTISLWSGKSSTRYQINNSGSYTTYSDAVGSYKDISHSGSLSNIKILHGSAGQAAGISAIKIDGTQLKDPASAVGDVSATNFNPFITDIHAVRGQETGYATWNPLAISASNPSLSDGNLSFTGGGSDPNKCLATTAMSSGKFYAEFTVVSGSINPGLATKDINLTSGFLGDNVYGWTYGSNGKKYHNDPSANGTTYGSTYTNGDAIGVAFNADNGILTFYKNGVSQGDAYSGLTNGPYFFATGGSNMSHRVNFGQKPFKFPPPAGFQPLNAANVKPETVIVRPDQFVGATIYDGNGGTKNVSTNHSPDLVWIKHRTRSQAHVWYDSVRTAGTGKALASNSAGAEGAQSDGTTYGYLSAFNNNGFTVIKGSDGEDYVNKNAASYVAWSWKAGGNKNTFNVDDVGYANASDVNMSVGSLNSVSYDKSVTWSSTSGMSSPTNAFDGSFGTGATVSSSGSAITVTTGSFTASSISFYKNGNNDANLATVTINNTSVFYFPLQSTATGWVTVDLGSEVTVTSLKTTWYGAYTLYAVKADTKLLVDNGTTTQDAPSIAATGASVGTKQGFSIVKYQGTGANATIPHGLSQPLDFLIVKTLTNSSINWTVWHSSLAGTQYLILNTQGAAEPLAAVWNSTVPTSSVISVGTDVGTNKDDDNYIAYCWHDVPGLQKFGSFEANQNADGPFIELGFRPAIVWIKNIDNYDPPYDWVIYDNARSTNNPNDKFLCANLGNVENSGSGGSETTRYVDFLSNGFKVRTASTSINLNAHTQIYCAWAEAPTFNLFGGQSNAR